MTRRCVGWLTRHPDQPLWDEDATPEQHDAAISMCAACPALTDCRRSRPDTWVGVVAGELRRSSDPTPVPPAVRRRLQQAAALQSRAAYARRLGVKPSTLNNLMAGGQRTLPAWVVDAAAHTPLVDDDAVRRFLSGEHVQLSFAERAAAWRRLRAAGASAHAAQQLLRIPPSRSRRLQEVAEQLRHLDGATP